MKIIGEAAAAVFEAAHEEGLTDDQARALGRAVRKVLQQQWTSERLADLVVRGRVQRLVDDELQRQREVREAKLEARWADLERQRRTHMGQEIERLQRERADLLIALAEATGETVTSLSRLYTAEVADVEAAA